MGPLLKNRKRRIVYKVQRIYLQTWSYEFQSSHSPDYLLNQVWETNQLVVILILLCTTSELLESLLIELLKKKGCFFFGFIRGINDTFLNNVVFSNFIKREWSEFHSKVIQGNFLSKLSIRRSLISYIWSCWNAVRRCWLVNMKFSTYLCHLLPLMKTWNKNNFFFSSTFAAVQEI